MNIYRESFWLHYRCNDLPGVVAFLLLDGIVNHGERKGSQLMQQALKINPNDGDFGQASRLRANMLCAYRESSSQVVLDYMLARSRLYYEIVQSKPVQQKFLKGWLNRLHRLQYGIALNDLHGKKTGVLPA